jgi:hypothetical protein
MNMKAYLSRAMALVVFAASPALAAEQVDLSAEVQKGLSETRRLLSQGDASEFGLKGKQELAELTVGTPLPVYQLLPQHLEAYQPGARVSDIRGPNLMLYYPVKVRGDTRFVLMLARRTEAEPFEFAGFGSAHLADGLKALQGRAGKISLLHQPQSGAVLALIETGPQEKLLYVPRGWAAFNPSVRTSSGDLEPATTLLQARDYVRQYLSQALTQ